MQKTRKLLIFASVLLLLSQPAAAETEHTSYVPNARAGIGVSVGSGGVGVSLDLGSILGSLKGSGSTQNSGTMYKNNQAAVTGSGGSQSMSAPNLLQSGAQQIFQGLLSALPTAIGLIQMMAQILDSIVCSIPYLQELWCGVHSSTGQKQIGLLQSMLNSLLGGGAQGAQGANGSSGPTSTGTGTGTGTGNGNGNGNGTSTSNRRPTDSNDSLLPDGLPELDLTVPDEVAGIGDEPAPQIGFQNNRPIQVRPVPDAPTQWIPGVDWSSAEGPNLSEQGSGGIPGLADNP